MHASEIPKLRQLSKPEKILLVEDLWENIAADDFRHSCSKIAQRRT